ncbi:hypothetical protein [Aequorivita lipolytica]|uniref:Uncharacterized protein n=1 Tax=Aequorivita lipolytica TaxID=153267 RepID=A0A5C6YRV9_9FLAO|nr:hypothetical protein [Aequorivita lipolytica]TXD70134.1 hypothetical protein ESV24_02895 [Aequorivita lipolytica]SRX50548.1 hypothetical protein AEQU2_01021 [Aequorivita lipolytica]
MKTHAHRIFIFIVVVISSIFLTAQNTEEYYLEIKPEYNLGTIQQTTNNDGTISITTNINDFSNFVNDKEVYFFEKAFPTSTTPRLQKVYLVTLGENEIFTDFTFRYEIENIIPLEKPILTGFYPNDYNEILYENPRTIFRIPCM